MEWRWWTGLAPDAAAIFPHASGSAPLCGRGSALTSPGPRERTCRSTRQEVASRSRLAVKTPFTQRILASFPGGVVGGGQGWPPTRRARPPCALCPHISWTPGAEAPGADPGGPQEVACTVAVINARWLSAIARRGGAGEPEGREPRRTSCRRLGETKVIRESRRACGHHPRRCEVSVPQLPLHQKSPLAVATRDASPPGAPASRGRGRRKFGGGDGRGRVLADLYCGHSGTAS